MSDGNIAGSVEALFVPVSKKRNFFKIWFLHLWFIFYAKFCVLFSN